MTKRRCFSYLRDNSTLSG